MGTKMKKTIRMDQLMKPELVIQGMKPELVIQGMKSPRQFRK